MYPYLEIFGIEFSMTWIGIIFSLCIFLFTVAYLCKKYHQDFLNFFYWMPIFIILPYFLGSYVQFVIDGHLFPYTMNEILQILSPRNYAFHFIGILIGIVSAFSLFLRSFSRNETKKIWVDILFFALGLSLVPLGIFLLFGDNFLGKVYNGILHIKALHANSVLNKFDGVYPVWGFLSLVSLISVTIIWIIKKYNTKKCITWIWLFGFIFLLIAINIVLQYQQYPKYIPIAYEGIVFDVKNYCSFFVVMFCLYAYNIRNQKIKN